MLVKLQTIRSTLRCPQMWIALLLLGAFLGGCSERHDSTANRSASNSATATAPAASNSTGPASDASTKTTGPPFKGPTAVEVARLFSKTNNVTDTTNSITDADRSSGLVSSAVLAVMQPAGVTIKVYRSSKERHSARLRLVEGCPGCNFLSECGQILAYEPLLKVRDMNQILDQQARERSAILRRHYKCD
jgi:hypothetical protein